MTAETETIARILARGFNEHIRLHGPDGDHADEAAGSGIIVVRRGVRYGVKVECLPAEDAALTLGDQVTSALLACGFRRDDDENRSRFPAFKVEETAAGVTVEVLWVNVGDDWRARLLAKYAAALTADGFMVGECDDHLHVSEGHAVAEADHG